MNQKATSADVVKEFFSAFGQGQLDKLAALFERDAVVQAVRSSPRVKGQLYGSYRGPEGVKEFVAGLGSTFNTKEFVVDGVVGEGETAFASGRFVHEVKTTGKLFHSDWALRCLVREGKIVEYRFFEDSQSFAQAAQ